ncbi:unnamed protein product [Spodoptera exigua]|nr:unnamed protein product [Spodoptera exigua]
MQLLIQASPLIDKLKHWHRAISFSEVQLTTSQKQAVVAEAAPWVLVNDCRLHQDPSVQELETQRRYHLSNSELWLRDNSRNRLPRDHRLETRGGVNKSLFPARADLLTPPVPTDDD